MARRRGLGILLIALVIGALAGTTVGEVIGLIFGQFMPGSMVEKFFLQAIVDYVFPSTTLNMIICSVTFGFTLKVNIISVIGIGVAAYYFRWY